MSYTETLLQQTEKSKIFLLVNEQGERYVRKELQGRHDVYTQLLDIVHPYLPRITHVTVTDEETIVFEEYIAGGNISEAGLTERQIRKGILELCEVVAFLHKEKILHRDIKPSNILLGEEGHIRLIDFDAARTVKEHASEDTQLLGTKGFAPPEQYGFAQTDQRADIYAIGVTLKTLLGPLAKKKRYRKILKRTTALDPNRRYKSTSQIQRRLHWETLKRYLIRPVIYIGLLLFTLLVAIIIYGFVTSRCFGTILLISWILTINAIRLFQMLILSHCRGMMSPWASLSHKPIILTTMI